MRGTASVPGWWVEFQAAVLRQLPRPDKIDQTTAESWYGNQGALKKVLADALLPPQVGQVTQLERTPSILELFGDVVVPATSSKFIAKEKFVRGTDRRDRAEISHLGHNFTKWFLSGDGKIENPISERTLHCYKLHNASVNGAVIAELGGVEKSETTLYEMFSLIERQNNGESGVHLNKGYLNIFYIRDQTGLLRTVDLRWDDYGWYVNAGSVDDTNVWFVSVLVFSRAA